MRVIPAKKFYKDKSFRFFIVYSVLLIYNFYILFIGERVILAPAYDRDDRAYGTNALVSYSLEKNVVEERTGKRLFSINPSTGEISTALCCLDRELTSQYTLQVVATDGGGLQGKKIA